MNAHISTSPDGAQGNTASPLGMGRSSHGVRSHSISSDRISLSGLSTPSHYLRNPTPDAAYIAPSTASHLVSTAQDEHWDSFLAGADDEDRRAAALVSVASLRLVNSFLDYILDCILVSAGSLSLSAVRPAVIKTLKPKLAEELLAVADHELEEYTGSMEEDELLPLASDALPGLEWDSESAWRVMRLRCMVYATLGEFEENDMEFFLDNQGLCLSEDQDAKMAIFLTAILEGVGEKVLRIAGQAAHRRGPVQRRQSSTSVISDQAGRLVVEELDTLKVASSPQLGRLWRGWRKTARSVTPSFSRPNLHGGAYRRSQRSSYTDGSRRSSIDSAGDYSEHRSHQGIDETLAQFSELEIAAKIPLPNEQDEEEIDGGNFAQMRSRSLVNPTSRSRSLTSPPHPERVTQHSRTSSLPAYKRIFDSVSAAVVSSIGVDRVHEKERAPIPSSKLSGGQAVRELISRARARGEVNNPQAFAREVGSDTGEDAETSRPDHSTETIRSHPRQSPRQVGSNAKHDNPLDASDRDFHDSEIVSFRKVSMEPARVPQIIETRSRASSKSKSHYSVDSTALSFDDDDQHDPHAIGVARTHNGISPPPSLRGAGGRLLLVDDGNPVSHGSSMKGSRYQADQATKNRGSTFVVPHAVEKRRRPEGLTIVERGDGGLRVLGGVPPPLTPLRELVEAAADTSDEASSVAPSQDAHSERDRSEEFLPYQRHSRGSDRFIKAQTDNLSNYPTRNESIPPASASAETEKSVIRPQPSSSKDARTVASNRSDSFGQTSRVSHSSGSGMAVAHRMSPTADSDSLPSEQTSLHGKNQSDDRGKNFEELIRRDETLKYTLTPHNVRSDSQVSYMILVSTSES